MRRRRWPNPLASIGRVTLGFAASAGRLVVFASASVYAALRPPYFLRQAGRQFLEIGYFSLPIVGLTAIFTGMVLALQSYTGFSRFAAESALPSVLVVSLTRELGPVLTALLVAGRVSGSIAAETGTMRVTEQLDALVTLSASPLQYLVAPRLVAGVLVLPPLVLVADVIGTLGGFLISVGKLGFEPGVFLHRCLESLQVLDVVSGLVKAAVFGFLIVLMGSYHGFHATAGARGVGRATTNAVMSASALILVANYLITEAFFSR